MPSVNDRFCWVGLGWTHACPTLRVPLLQSIARISTLDAMLAQLWTSVSVCLCVCVCVRALKGKRLELSTPNSVHIYSIAVARHALTRGSKGQRSRSHGYENRHGRTAASEVCFCCQWHRRGTARRMTVEVSSSLLLSVGVSAADR